MTEDDTFKALSRLPFEEMEIKVKILARNWISNRDGDYDILRNNLLAKHGWTWIQYAERKSIKDKIRR